jgi:acyl transferase domain-containing protein
VLRTWGAPSIAALLERFGAVVREDGAGVSGDDAWAVVCETLATLHRATAPVDWRAVYAPWSPRIVVLPTYPFERVRHWYAGTSGR